MAFGAARHSHAKVSVAVTGVAGPGGGSADKPVGLVWFGFSVDGVLTSEKQHFSGNRAAVRAATVAHALWRLSELIEPSPVRDVPSMRGFLKQPGVTPDTSVERDEPDPASS